jgi:ATP-dependent Clp protease ATP-binding subunit ClpC
MLVRPSLAKHEHEHMTKFLFFFSWLYTEGFSGLVSVWENVFRFLVRQFNFRELLFTLFSPWKRDRTPKGWVGLQIGKSLNRLAMNVFSRLIGAAVRLLVIVGGLFVLLLAACIGLSFVLAWLVALPAFIFFIVRLPFGTLLPAEVIAIAWIVIVFGIAGFSYLSRVPESFLPKSRRELFRKSWFPRVLGRLGLTEESFRPEDWERDDAFEDRLTELNMSAETFDAIVSYEALIAEKQAKRKQPFLWENLRKNVPIGRGWQFGYTVHLDRYSNDLSQHDYSEYGKLHLFGREDEFKVATLVMSRPRQNSLLLVGEAGIGKKTLIHTLARKIREGDLPVFEHFRLLTFDLGVAVGDAINRGEDVENAIRALFMEATYSGNVVLVIDDLQSFLGPRAPHANLSAVFAEFLALPSFRVIGMMGESAYHTLTREDDQVVKFFEAVYLREPEAEDTLRILLDVFREEERSRVLFTWKALQSIVELSGQYEWDIPYPEKAIDLAQETLLHYANEPSGPYVTPETVASFVSMKTGMPIGALGEDERERLLKLEEILHYRVVGQHEAVRQVSEALRRARAGFGNPNRPAGSFLFLGPTGVGKTETAKALAEAYFGDENRMVRLDMSEFQSTDAVDRLIGSVMTGDEGRLPGIMKEHPFSVLLLDEIEKAYPKALDIFLQILDEGFVTDGFDRKINFRKSIIIATSNASSDLIARAVTEGADQDTLREQILADISNRGTFRPEFLNRFDGLVFFSPLSGDELARVVDIKLAALAARIKKQKNIDVSFASGVSQAIVEHGYEAAFGARSLNRYIEDHIEDAIVRRVIEGAVAEGGELLITEGDLG